VLKPAFMFISITKGNNGSLLVSGETGNIVASIQRSFVNSKRSKIPPYLRVVGRGQREGSIVATLQRGFANPKRTKFLLDF
jgi:hypothetical protein